MLKVPQNFILTILNLFFFFPLNFKIVPTLGLVEIVAPCQIQKAQKVYIFKIGWMNRL